MRRPLVLSLLLLSACQSAELRSEDKALRAKADQIPVANTITVTELTQYKEIGPIECRSDTQYFSQGGADENCRNSLKLSAAKLGADLIVVEARDLASCERKHICVYMHGRAYKKGVEQK